MPAHMRVLLVGTGPLARATADDLLRRKDIEVLGALRIGEEVSHPALPVTVLGTAGELHDHLVRTHVDEVYLCADVAREYDALQEVVRCCERIGIPFAVPAHVFRLNRSATSDSRFATDGYLHYRVGIARRWEERVKRLFDIVAGSIALALLAPLFLVVAILVKVTSRGPVFFRQNRVGRHGRPFQMLKFRSMVVNAEQLQAKLQEQNEQTGPVFKMRSDPRITRVGRFIRRYSIDELPQFWNVVRGDMSIVGPRPPLPSEVVQYDAWQRRRLSMRPGLTCLWQTQGRNRIGFEQWMYLDLQYVDQWSVLSDLQLVARTIPAVISGDGAS